MPGPLSDPRHEAFCVQVASGLPFAQAYGDVGFVPNARNAARLLGKEFIRVRIAELKTDGTEIIAETALFRAPALFHRLDEIYRSAKKAGDLKVALEAVKVMTTAAGYMDSPTLTHEHLGAPLAVKKDADGNEVPFISDKTVGLMKSFQALNDAANAAGQARKAKLSLVPDEKKA